MSGGSPGAPPPPARSGSPRGPSSPPPRAATVGRGSRPMDSLARLASLPVYWGHGTQDDQVPVERARRDVARLRQAGVDVSYFEAGVGRKVGAGWLARPPAR